MLSSITPLGERAKGNSWTVTAGAHIVGALLGGTALGLLLAPLTLATAPLSTTAALWLLAALLVATATADALGVPIPTIRRQVDENWLTAYRGWVYGFGFGAQLGFALVTIITSWATWAAIGAAVLTGSPGGAVAVGATFGLARGLVLLAARPVDSPEALARLHRRIATAAPTTAKATRVALGALGAAAATAAFTIGVSA